MAGDNHWHGVAPSPEERARAVAELEANGAGFRGTGKEVWP
jgi:hypothetical protein